MVSGLIRKKVTWADEVENREKQHEYAECSRAPQRHVTSRMLLNKFSKQQEKERHREIMMHRNKEHWRCPFFIHYWEEGLSLPSVDNCPECNGLY